MFQLYFEDQIKPSKIASLLRISVNDVYKFVEKMKYETKKLMKPADQIKRRGRSPLDRDNLCN